VISYRGAGPIFGPTGVTSGVGAVAFGELSDVELRAPSRKNLGRCNRSNSKETRSGTRRS